MGVGQKECLFSKTVYCRVVSYRVVSSRVVSCRVVLCHIRLSNNCVHLDNTRNGKEIQKFKSIINIGLRYSVLRDIGTWEQYGWRGKLCVLTHLLINSITHLSTHLLTHSLTHLLTCIQLKKFVIRNPHTIKPSQ